MSQMKGQDKIPQKLNAVETGNFPEKKKNQNNDSKDDPGSWKNNGEEARNIQQRPRRSKEQTEMNNTLQGINSRITEAERISDLETEWWKSLMQNRIQKK